ncbi:MAG: cyclodeaminase/cyclohydrolase family protein, partial [Erysipelotrichales bacterium]|nr:cyclodeaminase/cyclohydrolase family protein [Erysipelotrichales bacterium]
TPGGGGVSALVGSLGSSLVAMYLHLSMNKKKYKEASSEVQEMIQRKMECLQQSIQEFLVCIDQDAEAFNTVISAYKLPKGTEEEKVIRNQAITQANEIAIRPPMQILEIGRSILVQLGDILPYGNANVVSDYAIGIILLEAAIQGAAYNIKINLSDSEEHQQIRKEVDVVLENASTLKNELLAESQKYL